MTREEIIKEFAERLRPYRIAAIAMSFIDDVNSDQETIIGIDHPSLLATLGAGLIDKTQNGLFTQFNAEAFRYRSIVGNSFKLDKPTMSVSVCMQGEWHRIKSEDELRALVSEQWTARR